MRKGTARKLRTILSVIDGFSVSELARLEGVSENTIRGRLCIPFSACLELGIGEEELGIGEEERFCGIRAVRKHADAVRPLIEQMLMEGRE